MSDEQTTYQQLAARFSAGDHKTKTIGGTGLTYVDGETVVSRLNEVLGFDGWSFEIGQIAVLEDEVWATGKLTVYSGDRVIVREQAGGQIINRTRGVPAQPARPAQPADGDRPAIPAVDAKSAEKGKIIELNNDIKGAVTDCLKKCATLVGVGLYLYDPQERREVEAEMKAGQGRGPLPNQPRATIPAASPGTSVSPTVSTPTVSPAAPISSSTTATDAPETVQQRWQRLVNEAEAAMLPTLGTVKAIDPKAVGDAQLKRLAERLEARLAEVRALGAA